MAKVFIQVLNIIIMRMIRLKMETILIRWISRRRKLMFVLHMFIIMVKIINLMFENITYKYYGDNPIILVIDDNGLGIFEIEIYSLYAYLDG